MTRASKKLKTTELRVHMDCAGCESKVRSTLMKLKGVDGVDIDMTMQKVTVTGYADQKKVLKTARKTGRRAELWQVPYNQEYSSYGQISQHQCNGPIPYNSAQPSSSYNYYKHGYDSDRGHYYPNHAAAQPSLFGHQATSAFSDENTKGCSVM